MQTSIFEALDVQNEAFCSPFFFTISSFLFIGTWKISWKIQVKKNLQLRYNEVNERKEEMKRHIVWRERRKTLIFWQELCRRSTFTKMLEIYRVPPCQFLCVWDCFCVWVHVYVHTYVYAYVYVYLYLCVVSIYICMYMCYVYIRACMHTCMCMYMCMHTCMCTSKCTCVHVCACILSWEHVCACLWPFDLIIWTNGMDALAFLFVID